MENHDATACEGRRINFIYIRLVPGTLYRVNQMQSLRDTLSSVFPV